jgi:hypothetical protein
MTGRTLPVRAPAVAGFASPAPVAGGAFPALE